MIAQSSGWSTNLPSVPMRIAAIQASPSLPTITISRFIYKPKYFRRPLVAKLPFRLSFPSSWRKLEVPAVPATKRQPSQLEESQKSTESEIALLSEKGDGGPGYGWLPAFPHVLLASMANVIFGYHIGVMNGPIVSIARELGFEGNSLLEGFVVSIFIAGAFIGSVSSGSLVDNLGCRRTIQVDTFTLILGPILSAQAHSLDEMLWGRFLVGLGIGVNTALVPIYISEVSPTRYRGSLGTLCQIGTCIGIIASLFLGIPSESDPHWWRTMLYIASLPAFILTFGMQFAVDSPRWLCKVGRLDDAKTVIRNLWGKSEVDKSIEEFQSVIRNDDSDLESSWLELLEEPHRRVAFIGGALFVLQQFAGINGVLYFSSLTFHDVGITSSGLASLLVGFTNFGGALLALYLMDKQGRKKLLIGSYLGMAASMFLIVFAISSPLDEQLAHNLSILGTLVYMFTFAVGAGPVTGLIIPELSSTRTRGKIMGFSLCVHWVCNFLVGLYFLKLVDRFGVSPVYASFGGVSLLSAIFASYFIVETKGHSLEEIEMLLKLPDTRK
ncbi:probable plastidic glucose transporter 1 isoform X1 [Macadamia integrifolia]|uniref:probable plastidic glucose transporter 1 isoform X1 n=1 Tax=Macadamia integrifolia TaxID=60698 RepID=UPI001C4EDCDC|nr:probable plastidic glucose transporter 1 isoform X1 [Macadamia integrifolia]